MGTNVLVLAEGASAMTTAFQGIATQITNALTEVAPIAIGIVGAFLVWKYGIKFFKGIAK